MRDIVGRANDLGAGLREGTFQAHRYERIVLNHQDLAT
jgi:hypothetical protein